MALDLGSLFPRIARQRVLVLGDLILDEYVSGDCSRVSPEAPVPVLQFSSFRAVLGGAANTAANVAALGGSAALIGLAGDDQAGREMLRGCERAGIRLIPVRDGRPTTRKVRVIGQQQQLLRLDYEQAGPIDADIEDQVLRAAAPELERADILVLTDYAKGLFTERLCQRLIAMAHDAGTPVVVDPRPQHGAFYAGCDYMTPNWKEAQGLLGWSETAITDEAVARAGRLLTERFGCHVILTLGSRGIGFFTPGGGDQFTVPTQAREVFDVSGAGDTVVAAFALARAAGCGHADAVSFANRAAGIVVGKRGTATVTPGELLSGAGAEPRLLSRDDLPELSASLAAQGKRIVTVNGSFDLLHAGHLHLLREAKGQGDVLIVGLNSDRSVRGYKGASRPIVPEAQRAEMLLAIRHVDYVHIFDEPVPMPFIEAVRPHVHVNGAEYGEQCIEAATVRAAGGRLHLVERIGGFSTSAVVEKIGRAS